MSKDMAIDNFSWVIPGKLAGSAIPGGRGERPAHILSDLQDLHSLGIRSLVSLQFMPPDSFGKLCKKAGLIWIHFPIEDFEAPANAAEFERLINTIIGHMKSETPVCAHCRAGVGRTGLLLACVVGSYLSIGPRLALQTVRKTRLALDNDKQEEFVGAWLSRNSIV
jgi:atypical dual specificity phosphatase